MRRYGDAAAADVGVVVVVATDDVTVPGFFTERKRALINLLS